MSQPRQSDREVLQRAYAALAQGDGVGAAALLQPIVSAGGANADVWLAVAHAAALQNDVEGKAAAIDKALERAPTDVRALISKADHLAAYGDARAATAFYSTAVQVAPPAERLSPPMREALERARAATAAMARELEDFVRARLSTEGIAEADAPERFSRAVDILFGRKRAYVQQPRYLFYPELPNIQFYDRGMLPWIDSVEASTAEVRADLEGVLGPSFTPYLTQAPDRPRNDQMGLVNDPGWSALFLHKDGREQASAECCPRTMAALAEAPLTRIPNRTPSVLFSKLAAGAHIPAHTGMLNTRLICHLPLIVPEGCAFRVGNDVRVWETGKAWAFDDTIEHEAWNRGASDRYILIFDVWRPELTVEERACVSALCQAIDSYRSDVSWDG
ncbi:MAG: aspartyl/asparaginyl beta-hydroxylase domain-containing protein [Hyphomonadaceae bacterium]|nr:aspartyl/asparaginyl beta-hydroxylase domain-containing protein [Hyphomonadaceae bacterium]